MIELKENLKILIVDDDDLICQTLNDIFEEKGYYIEVAKNGQIAKDKASQVPFTIFLIDLKLPDINGINLIKDLKEIRPKGIFFIITGYSSIQDVSKAIKDGVDGFFVKPLVIEEIEKRIMDFSEKREIQIRLENSEQKYRLISENVNDLIIMVNKKIEIEYVNEIALKNIFGFFSIKGNAAIDDILLRVSIDNFRGNDFIIADLIDSRDQIIKEIQFNYIVVIK